MKLRVGLIGLGSVWESRHRPALRALGDRFEVRAVCDQVAHRADQAAREFGASAVDGFRALACREDVDAVLMLAQQWYGALPILAACSAGKAVYCASGWDLDPGLVDTIKRRVYESGIAFMAEFPRRQAPATLRLKELIATHLGPPRLLFCHLRVPVRSPAAPPRADGGYPSPSHDLVELVDWCSYVTGRKASSVMGLMHVGREQATDDYQMMNLDFSGDDPTGSGPTAQISCGRYMPDSWPEAVGFRPPAALQVACERGIAFIDLPSTLIWFDKAGRHMESLENERPTGEQLLAQFHRSVTSLVRNTAGLDDAYQALAIVLTAQQSHAQGRRLDIAG